MTLWKVADDPLNLLIKAVYLWSIVTKVKFIKVTDDAWRLNKEWTKGAMCEMVTVLQYECRWRTSGNRGPGVGVHQIFMTGTWEPGLVYMLHTWPIITTPGREWSALTDHWAVDQQGTWAIIRQSGISLASLTCRPLSGKEQPLLSRHGPGGARIHHPHYVTWNH